MKIKEGFILRKISDTYIVVAVGAEAKKYNVMITLNETGGFLWKKLTDGASKDELISAILDTYDIDKETAVSDVERFLAKLTNAHLLDE